MMEFRRFCNEAYLNIGGAESTPKVVLRFPDLRTKEHFKEAIIREFGPGHVFLNLPGVTRDGLKIAGIDITLGTERG